MKRLIAFTGLKRSGKTAAAEATRWRHINFADPLKAMLGAYLRMVGASEDMIYEYIEGNFKETPSELLCGRSPRHAMQTLGTEWGRNLIDDQLWTEAYKLRVQGFAGDVVTSDLRFLNEAATVRELGGMIVRVIRPSIVSNDLHSSEQEMASIRADTTIMNDGSLKDLQAKVISLMG